MKSPFENRQESVAEGLLDKSKGKVVDLLGLKIDENGYGSKGEEGI